MKKPILYGLITGAIMLAAGWALKWAEAYGLIDGNQKAVWAQVIVGVALAVLANTMPKTLSGGDLSPEAARIQQRSLRVNGWVFMIAGLGYAALAFAPREISFPAGIALIAGAMVVAVGHMIACVARYKRTASAR